MAESKKQPFYKSCMFWIIMAIVWITIADSVAMLLPAWQAAKARREQEAAELLEEK